MALVAANRAWISPVSATLDAIPSAPPSKAINIPIPFRNTGHEPATDASIVSGSDAAILSQLPQPTTKFTPKNGLLKITASPFLVQRMTHLLYLWSFSREAAPLMTTLDRLP
jgi:hypothetical protein